jgi:hypothetical protein
MPDSSGQVNGNQGEMRSLDGGRWRPAMAVFTFDKPGPSGA